MGDQHITSYEKLRIGSPKRSSKFLSGWEGFFPYYAGFPESFASELLSSADLPAGAVVLDPWNGSGTTTYAASKLGYEARGLDINPVMVIIARARMLPPSEADALLAAANNIAGHFDDSSISPNDELSEWFGPSTVGALRTIERAIRTTTVGHLTITRSGVDLGRISGLAATLYVALFDVCRQLASKYRSTNPTWVRGHDGARARIGVPRSAIVARFVASVDSMAATLSSSKGLDAPSDKKWDIDLSDTTSVQLPAASADCILTSPPYCTRIDYTSATRVELAVLAPLLATDRGELSRKMIGSIRVPTRDIEPNSDWGDKCLRFLDAVKGHTSKASATYYYRTHLDYFDKMFRSFANLSGALKVGGSAFFVVQDSYYKDVHNDLPAIIAEMAAGHGLPLRRREDFLAKRSMARINKHTKKYDRDVTAIESVLCFEKAK